MHEFPASFLLCLLRVDEHEACRIEVPASLTGVVEASANTQTRRETDLRPGLSVVARNVAVQRAHEDHGDHAREEEHNHERVDDGKPVNGVCAEKAVSYNKRLIAQQTFGGAVEKHVPSRSPGHLTT